MSRKQIFKRLSEMRPTSPLRSDTSRLIIFQVLRYNCTLARITDFLSRGWNVTYDIRPPISSPHIRPPILSPPYQTPHIKPPISDPSYEAPYCKPPTISSPPYQALHFNMKPPTHHIKPLVLDVQNEPPTYDIKLFELNR